MPNPAGWDTCAGELRWQAGPAWCGHSRFTASGATGNLCCGVDSGSRDGLAARNEVRGVRNTATINSTLRHARSGRLWGSSRVGSRRRARPGIWGAVATGVLPALAIWFLQVRLPALGDTQNSQIAQFVALATLALAFAATTGCLVLWQSEGESPRWLVAGVGLLLLGSFQAWYLVQSFARGIAGRPGISLVSFACLATGVSLMGLPSLWTLLSRPNASRLRSWQAATLAAEAAGVIVLIELFFRGGLLSATAAGAVAASVCVAGAVGYASAWWIKHEQVDAYISVSLLGLAQAGVAGAAIRPPLASGPLAASLLRFIALACLCIGLALEFRRRAAERDKAAHEADLAASKLEHELEEEKARLRNSNHELRSVLLVVEAGVELLHASEKSFQDEAKAREAVRLVHRGAEALAGVVLAAETTEGNFDAVETANVEVSNARALGLDVELIAGGDEVIARGDQAATARALRVLLDNARIHAPGCTAVVEVEKCGSEVVVRICDNGPGSGHEHTPIGVNPGRGSPHTQSPGHGLGLAIARALLDNQGGELIAGTAPGGGARFEMHLVAAPAPYTVPPAAMAPSQARELQA